MPKKIKRRILIFIFHIINIYFFFTFRNMSFLACSLIVDLRDFSLFKVDN